MMVDGWMVDGWLIFVKFKDRSKPIKNHKNEEDLPQFQPSSSKAENQNQPESKSSEKCKERLAPPNQLKKYI